LQAHAGAFELKGIRGSELAKRRPAEIDKLRDEVWFCLVDAFRDGLAIPPGCTQLEGELSAIKFDRLVNGRAKVIGKPAIRRELGGQRSPDLADALALAAYEPIENRAEPVFEPAPPDMYDANNWGFRDVTDGMDPRDPADPFSGRWG
jgi:hypothetical protein